MRYILRTKNKMNIQQKIILSRYVSEILYESKYINVVGIEASKPDEIAMLDFVVSIRESRTGIFQDGEFLSTIIFEPPIRKSLLVNNDLVGWGDTRIAILDSGVNPKEVSITEAIDYTGSALFDVRNHGNIVANIVKNFAKGALIYFAKVGVVTPDELNVMAGIEWAVDKGVNLINISAGFLRVRKDQSGIMHECNGDCELCELVNTVSAERNVGIIVAAGNRCKQENSIDCPGNAINAITVGAIDKDRKIADYSSFGALGGSKPNLVAQGDGSLNGSRFSGTSFSAPLITGVLGAILYKCGNIVNATEYLYSTAGDLNVPRHHQGHGCLNIEGLVEVMRNEKINCKGSEQGQSS